MFGDDDTIEAGDAKAFFAEFRAVPKTVTVVDLRSLGRFENVVVTQS